MLCCISPSTCLLSHPAPNHTEPLYSLWDLIHPICPLPFPSLRSITLANSSSFTTPSAQHHLSDQTYTKQSIKVREIFEIYLFILEISIAPLYLPLSSHSQEDYLVYKKWSPLSSFPVHGLVCNFVSSPSRLLPTKHYIRKDDKQRKCTEKIDHNAALVYRNSKI